MINGKRTENFGVIIGFFLTLFTFFLFTQSALAATPKPQYGGTMLISDANEESNIGYPPKMFRPLQMRQGAPAIESLLRTDKTGKLVPWLATTFKEDAKAMTITLTLRKGIKFHDGTDFNAEAVKWNLEQHITVKAAGTDKIKSVDAVDPYTVRITLAAWDSTFLSNLAQFTGAMISPAAFKKNGEEWCMGNPVGTGPFQFVSRQQNVRLTYKKFDGYWQKGKPYLDKIEFVPIQDPMTKEFSLRKNEIDLMITLTAKNLKTLGKDGFAVLKSLQPAGARSIAFSSANPKSPFADLKVRQAAQHAVDTKALVDTIFNGEFEPANQQVYKGNWAYNESVVGYPYNPAKAKSLLTAAGYPNGFKTKLMYYTTPENDQVYTAVQAYMKAVGIDVELDPVQLGKWTQVVNGGKWEGMLVGTNTNIDVLAMIDQIYSGSGKYIEMLMPPDYVKAIQDGLAAPDFKTKQKRTQELMKIMTDKHCLLLTLYVVSEMGAAKPYLHDHGILAGGNNAIWTPENAWRDK
jgi:peptide/nickel transport system substrate-binding protein